MSIGTSEYRMLRRVYSCLLSVPIGTATRIDPKFQRCLAEVRDWVAKEAGIDPEGVQREFEAKARSKARAALVRPSAAGEQPEALQTNEKKDGL